MHTFSIDVNLPAITQLSKWQTVANKMPQTPQMPTETIQHMRDLKVIIPKAVVARPAQAGGRGEAQARTDAGQARVVRAIQQPAPVQRTEAATIPPHPPKALTPHHKKSTQREVNCFVKKIKQAVQIYYFRISASIFIQDKPITPKYTHIAIQDLLDFGNKLLEPQERYFFSNYRL